MISSIVFDALLIGTIVYCGYLGYKRGLIRSLAKLSKMFIAFALAYLIAPYFSQIFVEPLLYSAVSNRLNLYLLENFQEISEATAYEDLPTLLRALVAVFDVSLDFSTSSAAISNIVAKLSYPIVRIISLPISFAAVYFLIKMLIRFVVKVTDEIFKIKLLGIPNKILGCALSTFLGVILAWGITVMFNYFSSLPPFSEWAAGFSGGFVYDFFNKFTPLELLLSF